MRKSGKYPFPNQPLIIIIIIFAFTQGDKYIVQICFVDKPVVVLVNHVENYFKLLYLRRLERGEHIGPLFFRAKFPLVIVVRRCFSS